MEILIIENDHEEAKRKAKLLYSQIGRVWCRVLKEHIVFNKIGFRHLLGKGRKPRSESDQKRRFSLLPFAVKILADFKVYVNDENNAMDRVRFWAISAKGKEQTITVVVRQVGPEINIFSAFITKKPLDERFLCCASHQWSGKGLSSSRAWFHFIRIEKYRQMPFNDFLMHNGEVKKTDIAVGLSIRRSDEISRVLTEVVR